MTAAAETEAPDPTNQAIAQAVSALLDDSEVTVEQVAVYAGLNRSSLYKKLKGEFGWKATDIAALARYFSVLPGDLFTGADVLKVRHQGLEPRTCCFGVSQARDAVVIPFPAHRRNAA